MAANLDSLPNYTCLQTIDRTVRTRSRQPLFADKIRVEVAFIGLREMFAWPGSSRFEHSSVDEMITGGASGFGGFAGWTHAVFRSSAPSFAFAGESAVNNRRVLRFDFRVPLLSSAYRLRVEGREAAAPYSGSAWIDAETLDVMRIEVRAGESGLPLESAGQVTDYARTRIGASEFLLPVTSEQVVVDLEGNEHRNAIRFSGCRQYGAESSISFNAPAPVSAAPAEVRETALPAGVDLELRLESPIVFGSSAVGDAISARLERAVVAGPIVLPKGTPVSGRIARLEQVHRPEKHLVVGLEFSSAAAGPVRATFKAQLIGPGLRIRELVDSRFYGSAPVGAGIEVKGLDIDDSSAEKGVGLFRIWQNKLRVERGLRMSWKTVDEHPAPEVPLPQAMESPPTL